MKVKTLYKTLLLAMSFSAVLAQKVEKKFNESFKTNADVLVGIDASNCDIEVTTWNKDEVAVEAVITVEGLAKEEAEKYFKNWKFEALGNKSKVKISTGNNNVFNLGEHNFVYFNSNEDLPKILEFNEGADNNVMVIPDVDLPEIVIPEIDFDALITPALENLEFDFDKYYENGDTYFFQWKDGVNDITIKSKEEWEKFKKSKEYKKFKKSQKKYKEEVEKKIKDLKNQKLREEKLAVIEEKRKELLERKKEKKEALIERKKIIEEKRKALLEQRKERVEIIREAKEEYEKVHKEEIKEAIAKAQKALKNTSFSFAFSDDGNFTLNGKKVKVTKKIRVKVPKKATFDLNTRHCKVKLPKTVASGKVNYGTFNADDLLGGKLKVSASPTIINNLNACTLFINNVTDARIASVANSSITSNSSNMIVEEINQNVEFVNKYGDLVINNVNPNFKKFTLKLDYGEAEIDLSNIKEGLDYQSSSMKNSNSLSGNFIISNNNNTLVIKGNYAQLKVKK